MNREIPLVQTSHERSTELIAMVGDWINDKEFSADDLDQLCAQFAYLGSMQRFIERYGKEAFREHVPKGGDS